MNKKIKPIQSVLFLLRCSSSEKTAYTHRVLKLKEGLEVHGYKTGVFYIGDDPVASHTMIPLYIFKMAKLMRQYDVVHAGAAPSAHVAVLSRVLARTKVIFDMHGDRIQEIVQEISLGLRPKHTIFKTWIQNMCATYGSQYYLPASEPLKQLLLKRGISKDKITVIRNGVDLNMFSATPLAKRDFKVVTYAGKFQPYQALDHFVEAINAIEEPNIRFRIIGFGEEDQEIKYKIQQSLHDKVELIDSMPQPALIQQLQDSDILIIPRKSSPVTRVALPTKFAEYIALARPVIVANVDETAEFVRQSHCGCVYKNSGMELKRAILSLASLSSDELTQMGHAGRDLAEKMFSWKLIWNQYDKLLKCLTFGGSQCQKKQENT